MPLALEGIKIIEMGVYGPANTTGQYLADLGAEVVVVEPPSNRALGAEWSASDRFRPETNRNKRMIALDLRKPEGKEVLHRLVKSSDVLIEANRPGVAKRSGYDYETLSAINPKIIVASLTGFGQTGPHSLLPGHVVVFEAMGGWLQTHGQGLGNSGGDFTGKPWVDPFAIVGIKAIDNFAIAILSALLARERFGVGQYIEMAILDSVITVRRPGAPPRGEEAFEPNRPDWNVYECKDGKYMGVAAPEDLQWRNLCQGLGVPELVEARPGRGMNALAAKKKNLEIMEALQRAFKTRTRDDWFAHLSQLDTEVGKVNTLDEAAQDEQVKMRGMHVEVVDEAGYREIQYGSPIKLSKTPARKVHRRAPRLGEYTNQILSELGYSQKEISRLIGAQTAF